MLDLLDYCHRSVTKLLVECEGREGEERGKMVESGDEDSDSSDENTPSKKKILRVSQHL